MTRVAPLLQRSIRPALTSSRLSPLTTTTRITPLTMSQLPTPSQPASAASSSSSTSSSRTSNFPAPFLSSTSFPSTSPHISRNLLRRHLASGLTAVGTMIADSKQISTLQICKNAALDFVILDNEHGHFSSESLSLLCRHAVAIGLTPLVRVPDLHYHLIAQALDGGAQGLILPRIYSREEVARVVSYAHYPPEGQRGSAQWRAYAGWRGGGVRECMDVMNRETLLLFQVETKESVERMEEILSTEGVDGVLVGPNDLSINLGVPDDWDSEPMQSAMKKVVDVCEKLGIVAGIHVSDAPQSVRYAEMGYRLVSANSETGFMQGAAMEHVKTVKGALKDKAIDWADKAGKGEKAGY